MKRFNKKYILLIITLLLSFTSFNETYSQSGMRYPELVEKLKPYFADELISDIKVQLPQGSDYRIWGWDIGDFSGDGYNDLAISVKLSNEKKKVSHVYLFVDLDGFLTKVGQFPYDFYELPLEIGVVIRHNICYVTRKLKNFNWVIKGYKFENGVILLQEVFETERIGKYTHEKLTNFKTLQNSEKFLFTNNNNIVFSADYLTIPSFFRSRLIYWGHQSETFSNYIDYVMSGSYWWKGDDDCSFKVSSAYDETFLYFTIEVKDDEVVDQICDSCIADYIEVWMDASFETRKGNRFAEINNKQIKFRKNPKNGIFSFKIYPGDFHLKKAFVRDISTTDKLYKFQTNEIQTIKAVSNLTETGYILKFKIPFILLGLNGAPVDSEDLKEIGCSFVVTDLDNQFRPEESTRIASSNFVPTDPLTYGSLLFVPKDKWYGQVINVYKDDIINALGEYGF